MEKHIPSIVTDDISADLPTYSIDQSFSEAEVFDDESTYSQDMQNMPRDTPNRRPLPNLANHNRGIEFGRIFNTDSPRHREVPYLQPFSRIHLQQYPDVKAKCKGRALPERRHGARSDQTPNAVICTEPQKRSNTVSPCVQGNEQRTQRPLPKRGRGLTVPIRDPRVWQTSESLKRPLVVDSRPSEHQRLYVRLRPTADRGMSEPPVIRSIAKSLSRSSSSIDDLQAEKIRAKTPSSGEITEAERMEERKRRDCLMEEIMKMIAEKRRLTATVDTLRTLLEKTRPDVWFPVTRDISGLERQSPYSQRKIHD